jgi:hypothetical protein
MFLLSLLLLASLHAVAGSTVFASIPAFDGVHTVLAVLLLLSFPLLIAFLLAAAAHLQELTEEYIRHIGWRRTKQSG